VATPTHWEKEYSEWSHEHAQKFRKQMPEELINPKSDFEDSEKSEHDTYQEAPRETAADKSGDVRTMDRKLVGCIGLSLFLTSFLRSNHQFMTPTQYTSMTPYVTNLTPSGSDNPYAEDEFLFLVVQDKASGAWGFPKCVHSEGETMREVAKKAMDECIGDSIETWLVGNAPLGHFLESNVGGVSAAEAAAAAAAAEAAAAAAGGGGGGEGGGEGGGSEGEGGEKSGDESGDKSPAASQEGSGGKGGKGTNFYHRAQWLDGELALQDKYTDFKWLTKVSLPGLDPAHTPRHDGDGANTRNRNATLPSDLFYFSLLFVFVGEAKPKEGFWVLLPTLNSHTPPSPPPSAGRRGGAPPPLCKR
jgi:hypothetical protein